MTAKDGDEVDTMGDVTINWVEDARVLTTTVSSATEYLIVDGDGDDDDDGNISVSLRLFDQYGNGIRQNSAGDAYIVTMTLDPEGHATDYVPTDDDDTTDADEGQQTSKTPSVSSSSSRRGMARALFAVDNIDRDTHELTVTFTVTQPARNANGGLDSVEDDVNNPDSLGVQLTYEAAPTDGDTRFADVAVASPRPRTMWSRPMCTWRPTRRTVTTPKSQSIRPTEALTPHRPLTGPP